MGANSVSSSPAPRSLQGFSSTPSDPKVVAPRPTSSTQSTGRDVPPSVKRSMPPRTADGPSLKNLGLALMAATVPVAVAAQTKADPSSWVPDPGGPQYPDSVFDHPRVVQEGNCYSYGRNDPWHGAQAPGMVGDMAAGNIPSSLMGRLAYIAPVFAIRRSAGAAAGAGRGPAVRPLRLARQPAPARERAAHRRADGRRQQDHRARALVGVPLFVVRSTTKLTARIHAGSRGTSPANPHGC